MASAKQNWKSSAIVRKTACYGLSIALVLAALILQGIVQSLLPKGFDFPYAFFYLMAAFASAWYGGYLSGALACLLVMVGLPMAIAHSSRMSLIDLSRLSLFVGVSLLISRLAQTQRRAKEILRGSNDQLEARVKERTHELARAMTQVQEQKTLLQTIFDSIGEGIVVSDRNGRMLLSNPAAARILGKALQESIPDGLSKANDIFPTDGLTESPLRRAIHGEEIDDVLIQLQSGDPAANKWLNVSGRSLNSPDGSLSGGLAVFSDITERRQAQEALVESQSRYRTLAESLPHLVWTCRPDGWCDYLSSQWLDYTGRPAEEQLGYAWMEQLHDEDRAAIWAIWPEAAAQGRPFDIEFRLRRADGVYRWFKTRAVPLRDSDGRIVKWFGSNTDFDDYKRSEQKLRAQLQRLHLLDQITQAIAEHQDIRSVFQTAVRSLEDHLPIDFGCVCLYDPALGALALNCVGVQNEGLAQELTTTTLAPIDVKQGGLSRCLRGDLVYEPDTSQLTFLFPRLLSRSDLRAVVMAPLSSENKVFGILVAARRQANGFTSGDCEFLRQLSQHVALAAHQAEIHAALQQAYDELRQTQQAVMQQERLRALGQMASGIAHDINNALSPVALYTESLLEKEFGLSARAREYLETIQRAVEDVAQTVGRMREFYRQREPQLTLVPVDLNRQVQEVLTLSRARWSDIAQQQGIAIHVRTDLALTLPPVAGIESEVREALINLVFNAVDAMPEGGRLTLRTKATPNVLNTKGPQHVSVEVEDTGIGMNEETRRRCLEPFFTTKGERGTGLGLAMVYGATQRLNAEMEIESAVGKGTTMRLSFLAIEKTKPAEEAYIAAQLSRLRILVVDDDPLIIKSLCDTLERDGHAITAAYGGQQGIDLWQAAVVAGAPFAVVITDLGMPNVDGRKVATAVKALSSATPVILLTGWGQRMEAERDLPPHVDRILNKPPRLPELRAALRELVGSVSPTVLV